MKKAIALSALAISLLLTAQVASANTIFECTTKGGKVIKLTETADTVRYSFGKPNRPELVLDTDIVSAVYRPYQGVGRYMNYSVQVQNDDAHGTTSYQVFTSADKNSDATKAGVLVTTHDKKEKEILCHPNKIRVNQLETMEKTTNIPQ